MLGRDMIIGAIKAGEIHLDPLPQDLLNSELISYNSIDLSIGNTFWIPKPELWRDEKNRGRRGPDRFFIDPRQDAKEYWELMVVADEVLVIPPGMSVLAHTQEFVGSTVPHITSKIRAKSSSSGFCIEVGADALFGDPGYYGRWTLRLKNSTETYLALPVGAVLAQIYFEHVGINPIDAPDGPLYTGHRNVHSLAEWTPEAMLPKSIKVRSYAEADYRIVPEDNSETKAGSRKSATPKRTDSQS